jgi:general secretion pathway protein D
MGTVESVDGQTVVLNDAIQIIEGRSMHSVPVLSKIPYVSRMFRNSGVGRESRKMSAVVVVPREKIAGAFELSASGAETLLMLQQVDRIGVDYEED